MFSTFTSSFLSRRTIFDTFLSWIRFSLKRAIVYNSRCLREKTARFLHMRVWNIKTFRKRSASALWNSWALVFGASRRNASSTIVKVYINYAHLMHDSCSSTYCVKIMRIVKVCMYISLSFIYMLHLESENSPQGWMTWWTARFNLSHVAYLKERSLILGRKETQDVRS